jgi:hypothetical protein
VEYYQPIELKMFEVVKPIAIVRPLIWWKVRPPYLITQDQIDEEKRQGQKIVIKFWEDRFNVYHVQNSIERPKRHLSLQRAMEWHLKHFTANQPGSQTTLDQDPSTSSGIKRTVEKKEEEDEDEEKEDDGYAALPLVKKKKRVRMNLFSHLEESDEDSEEESTIIR